MQLLAGKKEVYSHFKESLKSMLIDLQKWPHHWYLSILFISIHSLEFIFNESIRIIINGSTNRLNPCVHLTSTLLRSTILKIIKFDLHF